MYERTRPHSFHLRLTDAELADLKTKAAKAGLRPQSYIHAVLKGHKVIEKPALELINVLRNLSYAHSGLKLLSLETGKTEAEKRKLYWENLDKLSETIHNLLEFMYGN